ncbi:hypothetical protein HZA75_06430 [Candidatus Roizmanbacteria bacterium]|nr:hypothetical protein [Candidatus Roizmanbacteria bacterium]
MDVEEYKKMIGAMTEEEIKVYFKSQPMKKYDRLNYIFVRVTQLLDFMKLIDNNASQLTTPASKAVVGLAKKGIRPSQFLYEYVMQEVSSFYTLAYQYKKEGAKLPEVPDYWGKLKDFRNSIPGHMDKDEKMKTTREWFEKYESIDNLNTEKIISEFEDYYKQCVKILGKDI